jgi:hypothetical protein
MPRVPPEEQKKQRLPKDFLCPSEGEKEPKEQEELE